MNWDILQTLSIIGGSTFLGFIIGNLIIDYVKGKWKW